MKIGDKVHPVKKNRKQQVWDVIGFSNVFKDNIIITRDDTNLCHHVSASDFYVVDLDVLRDHDIPPNTIVLER